MYAKNIQKRDEAKKTPPFVVWCTDPSRGADNSTFRVDTQTIEVDHYGLRRGGVRVSTLLTMTSSVTNYNIFSQVGFRRKLEIYSFLFFKSQVAFVEIIFFHLGISS